MNFKSIAIFCILPLAVFASDAVQSLDMPQEQMEDSTAIVDSSKIVSPVTESEFSGNLAVDSADVGNVDEIAADSSATMDSANVIAADVADADSAETDDGKEMSQEEADAELAAAMDTPSDSASANDTLSHKLILDMTTAIIPTESRRVASPYGIRTYRMHRGVDLGLCHGEDRTIVAAFAGKVKLVRNQGRRRGYGKYVVIDHGNGLTTLYAHLASWNVNIGDEVQAGDTIGIGGNTGRSFGAHLHFEMKYNGVYIDPTTVFNFAEGTFISASTEIDQDQIQNVEDDYQKELAKHRYYKVRRGDCLGKIARRYGISVGKLKRLNGLKSNRIRPGQVLRCS